MLARIKDWTGNVLGIGLWFVAIAWVLWFGLYFWMTIVYLVRDFFRVIFGW